MAMTKGAQRRNSYVTFIAGVAFIVVLTLQGSNGWVDSVLALFSGILAANALRTLADIGFTKRADNER